MRLLGILYVLCLLIAHGRGEGLITLKYSKNQILLVKFYIYINTYDLIKYIPFIMNVG